MRVGTTITTSTNISTNHSQNGGNENLPSTVALHARFEALRNSIPLGGTISPDKQLLLRGNSNGSG